MADLAKRGVGPEVDPVKVQGSKSTPKLPLAEHCTDCRSHCRKCHCDFEWSWHNLFGGVLAVRRVYQGRADGRHHVAEEIPLVQHPDQATGLSESGMVPFHILAIAWILQGRNTAYGVVENVVDELEKIKSHA
jgi:hypothetical protein